ncbi:MAG: hypothetical protein QNK11_09420 [Legionella sp.]|nr:hypothetical protein [Legionella sp.]
MTPAKKHTEAFTFAKLSFSLLDADVQEKVRAGTLSLDLKNVFDNRGNLAAALECARIKQKTEILSSDDIAFLAYLEGADALLAGACKKPTRDTIAGIVDYPASLNDGRLYLVWTVEMLLGIGLLLQHFRPYLVLTRFNRALSWVSCGTGIMGWSLYFARGGTAAAYDVPKGLILTPEEEKAYFDEKWKEQKFTILNDAVWGVINFVCFFILVGYWGDVLNFALFFFDLTLQVFELWEKRDDHNILISEYDAAINALKLKEPTDAITLEIERLERVKAKVDREGQCAITQLAYDVIYSTFLLFAFLALCCFFVYPGVLMPLTEIAIILAGGAMCFGLGIIHAAFSSALQISTTQKNLRAFDPENNPEALRDYYNQVLVYQRADMACTLAIDMALPAIFLAAFIFMPVPIGAPVFALSLVLMLAAKCYVAELAPKEMQEEDIPLGMLTKITGFFKPAPESKPTEVEPPKENHGDYRYTACDRCFA